MCISVQNVFKQLQSEGTLTSPEAGSIPSSMKTAMKAAIEMENDHMQPMATLIDTVTANDVTHTVTVQDVKEMLNSAAKALTLLQQYLQEAKALVQKFKKEKESPQH